MGHIGIAISHVLRGDNPSAIETLKKAHSVSADPLYTQIVNLLFGLCYLQTKNFEQSRNALQEVIHFGKENGCEWAETPANLFMGVVLVSTGKMSQGYRMIEKVRLDFENNNKRPYLVIVEYILGKIYLQMVDRNESINLSTILKNIVFLLRNLPFAAQKAEQHFLKAVEMAKEIGASGMLGQIYLDLGLLYKKRKKTEKAKNAISLSISLLEKSKADFYLEQANESMKAIK